MKIKKPYSLPDIFCLEISEDRVICTSPQPGQNEDVGYEDWSIYN